MNIINGGEHADNPDRLPGIHDHADRREDVRRGPAHGCEVFHALKKVLKERGISTAVGDEGGFAPKLESTRPRWSCHRWLAVKKAGYKLGKDIAIGLDCAAQRVLRGEEAYQLKTAKALKLSAGMRRRCYKDLGRQVPDHLDRGRLRRERLGRLEEADRRAGQARCSWSATTSSSPTPSSSRRASTRASPTRSCQGQPDRHADRDLDAIEMAKRAGYTAVIISHRSGETGRLHDRRHRRRHQRRPDQDRLDEPLRPHRQVQPAAAHRGASL
jgi:enolase